MKFNLVYFGKEDRRDFALMLRYALEALGHDVVINHNIADKLKINIFAGAYRVPADMVAAAIEKNVRYIVINTETIDSKTHVMNAKPGKTDMLGAYVPLMKGAEAVWDVIPQNLLELKNYGIDAKFLRWGYVPELEELRHKTDKEFDFYFFGVVSPRREEIIKKLIAKGFKGAAHQGVPIHIRNSYIERSKICLNLIQKDEFTHVNNFRICYLANNKTAVLAERNSAGDPAGYLSYTFATANIEADLECALRNYQDIAEIGYTKFKKIEAKDILEELLDASR